MAFWMVQTGNVRRIAVYDQGDGCAYVSLRTQGGAMHNWHVWSKTLCDCCHGAPVSVPDVIDVLYAALRPGRRSWLTRWLNAPGGGGDA